MKPKYYILDDENRPVSVDLFTWAEAFDNLSNRIVGWTQITSEITVSTVFLGFDHRHLGEGPPILFETMIFGGPLDQQMWRYCSWDDAVVGHGMAVEIARKAIKQQISPAS
jgi:hypothetical protein